MFRSTMITSSSVNKTQKQCQGVGNTKRRGVGLFRRDQGQLRSNINLPSYGCTVGDTQSPYSNFKLHIYLCGENSGPNFNSSVESVSNYFNASTFEVGKFNVQLVLVIRMPIVI